MLSASDFELEHIYARMRLLNDIDLFILSSPRSGSTFLRLNLNKLKDLTTLPETHFFNFQQKHKNKKFVDENDRVKIIRDWLSWYKVKRMNLDTLVLEQTLMKTTVDWSSLLDQTITLYLQTYAGEKKNKIICEKSSTHILYQDKIKEQYPNAKAIYLVRDPRAVVASLKTCSWSTSNIVTNARVWRKGIHQIGLIENHIVIKYEDLIRNPDTNIKKICSFLGITANTAVFHKKTDDFLEKTSEFSKHALHPPSPKHIEKWKYLLSTIDRDVEIVESICKKEMIYYGYELSGRRFDYRFYSNLFTVSLGSILSRFGKN